MNNILIYDEGGIGYTHIAQSLVGKFDEIGYFTPHIESFPITDMAQIGKGIEGVTWIDNFFDVIDDYETIFFPDCKSGDLQLYLKSKGKNIFGSFKGSEMENDRWGANELWGEVGLPKVPMERIIGINKLRSFLKENDNIYVKSNYRGICETFYAESYKLVEPYLDDLEHELGLYKNEFEFICCYPIDGDDVVESGADLYTVDGQYPDKWVYSYEIKDLGSVSVVKKREFISKLITEPFDKIALALREYGYRNFISNEIRIKNRKPYMTDLTCRVPSPVGEVCFAGISNIAEIIQEGAKGNFVQPNYNFKYGVEAIITSTWAEKNWQPVYIDNSVKDYVRLKYLTIIDGTYYCVPHNAEVKHIGAVFAYGDTLDEAIKKLKKYADGVSGYDIKVNVGSMEKAKETILRGTKIGISF